MNGEETDDIRDDAWICENRSLIANLVRGTEADKHYFRKTSETFFDVDTNITDVTPATYTPLIVFTILKAELIDGANLRHRLDGKATRGVAKAGIRPKARWDMMADE
jgi:hypothetical protein